MDTLLQPQANVRGKLLIKVKSLEKPKIVSFYSSDELSETETTIRLDASNCKYFKGHLLAQDNPQIDLKSYVDFIKNYKSECSTRWYNKQPMVLFLLYLEKIVSQGSFNRFNAGKLFEADIICCVNILIKMMMLHGNFGQSFTLLATKYKGNIYLTQRTNGANKPNARHTIKAVARHALFADHPNTDVNSQAPFATKFHCVFDFKLRDASVMFSSCVQGVKSDNDITSDTNPSNIEVVRTKTKFCGLNERNHATYRTPHWWCHSYLFGNADIHVVEVDDDDKVERINTFDMVTFLCEYEKRWKKSSDERISFLRLLIDLIKLRMTFVNCPYTVYEFYCIGEGTIHYNVHSGRSEFTFFSDQYVNATKDF